MELKFSENQDATQEKININFYNDLEKAKSALTEDIVFNHFRASAKIKLQDICRKLFAKGENLEKIAEYININMDSLLVKSGRVKKADIISAILSKITDLTVAAATTGRTDLIPAISEIARTTSNNEVLEIIQHNWNKILHIEEQLAITD